MVWRIVNFIVEYFDMSEKDMIMVLFFGTLFLVMLTLRTFEIIINYYKKNEDALIVDAEFIIKVALTPFISLALLLGGKKKNTIKKVIARFLYA